MAKYRTTDAAAGQGMFLTVNLQEQLLPGTFEYMLDKLIGRKINVSIFDRRYKNDLTGASAVPPSVLLKLVIYGYYTGNKSSRKISELNSNNIIAKALTGDMDIHWTTIADFISNSSEEIEKIFVKVLMYCNELGLIGGETFAIDGLRLPSNASIEMSGTKEQLEKRLTQYRKMAEKHLSRHRLKDESGESDAETKKHFEERQKHLNCRIEKLERFLENMEPRVGRGGDEVQSNVTDNESAMIHSSKGFVQGYIGIAVSDQKNQIIISAQAVGTANEGEHLPEMLDKNTANLKAAGVEPLEEGQQQLMLGDANYYSEENFRECEKRGVQAIMPSTHEKRQADAAGNKKFDTHDFTYNEHENKCVCPYGKDLEYKGTTNLRGGEHEIYQASLTDCKSCPCFSQCTWSKKGQDKIVQGRKILIPKGKELGEPVAKRCKEMNEKLATEEYKAKYAQRIQIVEPVFANIRYCKGLNRFSLRGKEKVNGQWLLYCIVHNLGKCLNGYNTGRKAA